MTFTLIATRSHGPFRVLNTSTFAKINAHVHLLFSRARTMNAYLGHTYLDTCFHAHIERPKSILLGVDGVIRIMRCQVSSHGRRIQVGNFYQGGCRRALVGWAALLISWLISVQKRNEPLCFELMSLLLLLLLCFNC